MASYKKKKKVTLKDIATKLGVSHTTVSRALRDHPDISPERKEEIKRLARQMHYNPNTFALNLRNAFSKNIGLILPEISLYAVPSMIRGITEFCYQSGYNVIIISSQESYLREKQNVEMMLRSQVDGILVAVSKETKNYKHFKEVEEEGIPIVFFDRVLENYGNTKVIIDDFRASYNATVHLINSGRLKLAYFGGNKHLAITQKRLEGFRKALKDNGLSEAKVVFANSSIESRKNAYKIFTQKDFPDGILSISDEVLTGIIPALQELNCQIPNQVGIISFSDGPISQMYKPSISIIHHSLARVGQVAVDLLIHRIENPEQTHKQIHIIDTQLIERESTEKIKYT